MAGEGHGEVGCPNPHSYLGGGQNLGFFPGHLGNHIPGNEYNPWDLFEELKFWA